MEKVVYFNATPARSARGVELALEHAARQSSPLVARSVRFRCENAVPRLLKTLSARDVDVLVIDARQESGPIGESPTLELLRTLFSEQELRSPIGREQTWLLVNPDPYGVALSFEAGLSRLAGAPSLDTSDHSWKVIWEKIESTLRSRKGGKIALCLAGGGIEGLFYELGVLRALQHFMPDYAMHQADILCGISAGAIISAFMANGLSAQEILRGMQSGEGKLDQVPRFGMFDLNVPELLQRLSLSARSMLRGRSSPVQSLFRLAPTGLFAGNGLRSYLETQFHKPGLTNDFRELQRLLFIGATDQDTAEHIVFGSPGWEHIPIHRAVRASTALTPFFAPERIENRYFVDGAFTRTTNVRIAVENGASLVILIDPLVPIYSEQAGFVFAKGGIMVGMQGLKSLIHGRFDRAVHMLRSMYPHVAFHLFQPDGATMRVMAGSPSKLFQRGEIEEIAFRETLRSIRQLRFDTLQSDFGRHDIAFTDPQANLGSIKRDLLDEASEVQVA